ncbi:MAG: cation:dicarboxylase symporter family transporter [Burkholderiales bacterium]|nr:cation:dicarboxylase symporter family transporter [Burkholderiales bacterium]
MQNELQIKKSPWFRSLWFFVIIFMIAGIFFGILAPDTAKQTKPIIDTFISVIKILVGPIIFFTVISGIIGMGNLKQLGSIGAKSFLYFEAVSTIALVIGLGFGHIFQPGNGLNLSVASIDPHLVSKYTENTEQATSMSKILLSAVPNNIWTPFITGNTLQILFIAIICGFILFYATRKKRYIIIDKLHLIQKFLFKTLSIVMWFSPIAAFSAMGFMLGQFGIIVIWHMLGLVITMFAACTFFILIILGSIAKFAGINILQFIRFIKDEIILVFATSSSESALGPIMRKLKNNGINESVVGIVIPAGYSFNLDGTNIYLALVIAFLSQAFNIHLSLEEYFTIILVLMATSKGAAGVSGAGFIVLAGTLAAMHGKIPVVTIAILLGIDKIMSELRAVTNLVGNSMATIIVAKMENKLDEKKLKDALKQS